MEEYAKQMSSAKPDRKLIEDYQAHHSKRAGFITESSTGFVWLYLQK